MQILIKPFIQILPIIPIIWIVLAYTKTPEWREFFISLLGLSLPFTFTLSYYFFTDQLNEYTHEFIISKKIFFQEIATDSIYSQIYFIMLFILILLAGLSLFQLLGKNIVKIRKLLLISATLIPLSMLTLLINNKDYIATYILLTIPLAIFLAKS